MRAGNGALAWLQEHCPSLDGQFLFLDPLWLDTHLLSEGAVLILREAAAAIDDGRLSAFEHEIADMGGWPPGLERLVRSLATLPVCAPVGTRGTA
ncbi:MAG: hypothetical protein PWP11_2084 [Thauera sp.]|nr:hypothetical protein [Thauera sp.]